MVKVKEDMTGWKMWEHGVPDSRLTVVKQIEDYVSQGGVRRAQWLCECSCSDKTRIIAVGTRIKNGRVKSCGCLAKELTSKRNKKRNKKYNKYDLSGKYGIGYCSNTGSPFYFDLEDYDKIKDYCWHLHLTHRGYKQLRAKIPGEGKHIVMHILLGYKGYDHIDRNPLNNCKDNLRQANATENARNRSIGRNNTSGFIGVIWNKAHSKWNAFIVIDKKRKYLGYFNNKEDAVLVRLEAESKYYGEFAPQRHLFEEYGVTVQN